jgi:anti-sigma-K factor RskA
VDLSCIISSGDLELYVLGLLPEDEALKINQLITIFPEIGEEVDRITETLLMTAASSDAAPRNTVKENLFRQIQDMQQSTGDESQAQASVISMDKKAVETVPVAPVERKNYSMLAAAAFIGLIVSIGTIIWLVSENNRFENQVAALQTNLDTVNKNLAVQQQQNIANAQLLQVLQDTRFKEINLESVKEDIPQALARVFWNPQTSEVYIVNVSLPKVPAGKQYQLWAIVDGQPVSAGMLQNEVVSLQQMETFSRADAFAITLEDEGGHPAPQGEMYVLGKPS